MEEKEMRMVLVALCMLLLFGYAVCKKAEWLLDMILRGVWGSIAVYFLNTALSLFGVPVLVGINVITILTSAILGIPGLLALYGIGIYRLL